MTSSRRLRGEYSEIKRQNEELISNLIFKRNVLFPTIGLLYEQLAEVYYEWNELEMALKYANKGLKLGLDGGDIWTIAENHLVLAKIHKAEGLEQEYMASIEKAEETIDEHDLFDVRLRLECYKAEVMLQKGIEKPISKWLRDIILLKKEELEVVYPDIYIVKTRYYINENLLGKAKKVLDILELHAEENKLIGLLIEVKILSSISLIYSKLENKDKAFKELNCAINLSLKEKPIQVYLKEGNLIKELLKKFNAGAPEENK